MKCQWCGNGIGDNYCPECQKRGLPELFKKFDPADKRDFVTQKEVDSAIADLQRLAQDLEDA